MKCGYASEGTLCLDKEGDSPKVQRAVGRGLVVPHGITPAQAASGGKRLVV